MGFQDFVTHFLNEVLSQEMAHINDLPFLGDAQVFLGILFSCVTCDLFISHGQYHFLLPSYFFG